PIFSPVRGAESSVMSMILSVEQARQSEAHAAWAKGQLVIGAYYQHRESGWLRRLTHLDGRHVYWADARPGPLPARGVQERSIGAGFDRGRFMQTIGVTALIAFGLATPATAAGIVPEEYQGVWAGAQDCKENFQNVLSNVVNRKFAA